MSKAQDPFEKLSRIKAPKPSDDKREQAFLAAMQVFDDVSDAKKRDTTKGLSAASRPTSITNWMKGLFAMENRVAVTAAMTGLLLLPLGYLLYSNTSLTPFGGGSASLPDAIGTEQTQVHRDLIIQDQDDQTAATSGGSNSTAKATDETRTEPAVLQDMAEAEAAAPPEPAIARQNDTMTNSQVAVGVVSEEAMPLGRVSGQSADGFAGSPAPIADRELDLRVQEGEGDRFAAFEDADVKTVSSEPVSTFSIDVDTASYSYLRRALNDAWLPHPDAIRIEELINAFDYSYAAPDDPDVPFATHISVAPSPWDDGKQVMRIGVQGFDVAEEDRPPANLVFLIDSSGSMDAPDKLPLLVRSFSLMLDALNANDTVSIVAYAGSAGVVLEPTSVADKSDILDALNRLSAGGSTAGAAGIEAAYDLAADAFVDGGSNQVILATDGDFNVGRSDPQELIDFIADKRDDGIFLSVLGFGTGNLNDQIMQALAQNGNGTAHYIDGLREARSVLVNDLTRTLVPIAKDVKIQVEFNPAQIAEYRLIGYETRALNREDFNNDRVDAGEVGAGASVTAIYELTPVGSPSVLVDPLRYGDADDETTADSSDTGEMGYFKLRYKLPDEDVSRLIEVPITSDLVVDSLAATDDDMRFALAVASLGQKLRGNDFVHAMSFDDIRKLAAEARATDPEGYRSEFLALVDLADALSR